MTYDAVVVGGGPAGFSAATWLARYRARVLLLDGGEQRNRWVDRSHGYLGDDPVTPRDLLARAGRQLAAYPEVERRDAQVRECARRPDAMFAVEVDDGPVVAARLVLATGVEDVFPEVGGFFEHYGASVFHCPTCDGYETQGRDVVALGWSAEITGFALSLLGWAASVTVVTDGRRFQGDDGQRAELARSGVAVLEDDATELLGTRGDLRAVELRHLGQVPCQVAFFSIAHHPRTALARQLGCALTPEGCIEVDDEAATSVPGVYAAGDVTPGLHLVQVAAAKGTVAGVACARSLRGEGAVPRGWQDRLPGYSSAMTEPTHSRPTPPPDPGRLEELEAEIDEIRDRVDDPLDQGDAHFIDNGEADADLTDDTIAPPG